MKVNEAVLNVLFKRKARNNSFRLRKDGNFYLGTSPSRGQIISLNALDGEICISCDSSKTIGEIYIELTAKHPEIDKDIIAYDLCKYVSDLERMGMLSFRNK